MRKRLLVISCVVIMLIITGCQAEKPPIGAVFAAFHFCPTSECSDVKLGSTTQKLPYSDKTIYDRWCVEVQFTRNNKTQNAAVEVVQVDTNAKVGMGDWTASDPVFNADCSIFK